MAEILGPESVDECALIRRHKQIASIKRDEGVVVVVVG